MSRPRLAVTLGDPRGIGPEIVERAARDDTVHAVAELVLVGPRGPSLTVDETVGDWKAGSGEAAAGALAGRAIERAVELARSGAVQGIVTAPIDKHALLAGGFDFPGPWGKSTSRNITSSKEKGIGGWTDAEIKRAITEGISRDGSRLKPPMGFEFYKNMTNDDLDAIVAYLRTVPPKE